jgi:hypothetical protein
VGKNRKSGLPAKEDPKTFIENLVNRAQQGQAQSIEVQALLEVIPEVAELAGNQAKMVEALWLSNTTGNNQLLKKAQQDYLSKLRIELGGDNPTALERLLIDRIVLCHVQINYAEAFFVNKLNSMDGLSTKGMDLHQHWIDKAQARLLNATRALAVIRKLALPTVLLNMAKNQVNIGSLSVADNVEEKLQQLETTNE